MLKAVFILLIALTNQAVHGEDRVPLKTVAERFGEPALTAISESIHMDVFQLDGVNWNFVHKENRDPSVQWSWQKDYRIVGEAITLPAENRDTARNLLVSEYSYWDVPPGETLMCLYREEYALLVAGKDETFVALFGENCARLFLYTESGDLVGGGMVKDEAKTKWVSLFEEFFVGE